MWDRRGNVASIDFDVNDSLLVHLCQVVQTDPRELHFGEIQEHVFLGKRSWASQRVSLGSFLVSLDGEEILHEIKRMVVAGRNSGDWSHIAMDTGAWKMHRLAPLHEVFRVHVIRDRLNNRQLVDEQIGFAASIEHEHVIWTDAMGVEHDLWERMTRMPAREDVNVCQFEYMCTRHKRACDECMDKILGRRFENQSKGSLDNRDFRLFHALWRKEPPEMFDGLQVNCTVPWDWSM